MQAKLLSFVAVPVLAVAALGGAATYVLSGTQSTTGLDGFPGDPTTVTVDSNKALAKNIVEGRITSKYHPLPWIGTKVTGVSCPSGLKAVTGTRMTCTARSDGRTISIPVTVVKADDRNITWKFDR
jgi:hypothetical protein